MYGGGGRIAPDLTLPRLARRWHQPEDQQPVATAKPRPAAVATAKPHPAAAGADQRRQQRLTALREATAAAR